MEDRSFPETPETGAYSIIALRLWLNGSVLRLAPAWALLAGVLLAGSASITTENMLQILLSILLVDAVWGAMWNQIQLLSARDVALPAATLVSGAVSAIPYAQPSAPVTRFWLWLSGHGDSLLSRDVWLAFVMASVLALMLNHAALYATLLVAVSALIGAFAIPALPSLTRFLGAVVGVGLAMWLGLSLFMSEGGSLWPQADTSLAWLIGTAFTGLAFVWEEVRAGAPSGWVWVSQGFLVGILLLFGEYGAAILAVAILIIPAVQLAKGGAPAMGRWYLLLLLGVSLYLAR
ncbi:MAG: hypothetical protein GY759_23205 [Chloroflexi bacterium]|nr:hypothetical protein [Chloroflexota bacterium]